jgi:hypothetical protein
MLVKHEQKPSVTVLIRWSSGHPNSEIAIRRLERIRDGFHSNDPERLILGQARKVGYSSKRQNTVQYARFMTFTC